MSELLCVLWPVEAAGPEPGTVCRLEPDESHHLLRVRRVGLGREVWAVVGDGRGARCTLTGIEEGQAELRVEEIVEGWRESELQLTLYQAPIRARAFEEVLESGTGLGLTGLVSVLTARVERNRLREDRLARIAAESAKQCGRGLIPETGRSLTWREFMAEAAEQVLLVADESGTESAGEAARALRAEGIGRIGLLIGPEGGLTPEERAEAAGAGGRIVHLGVRRLRSETAAIAALSLILCEYK
jgi:16S rRNA (uracil1498-N3)-methyltransferase